MSQHLVTSHGADFFGQDRHPLALVSGLAAYVRSAVPFAQRSDLGPFLERLRQLDQALAEAGARFEPDEAATLGEALLNVSRLQGVKPKVSAAVRLLADAATRAAAAREPWEWRIETA